MFGHRAGKQPGGAEKSAAWLAGKVTAVDIHVEGVRKDKMEGLSGKGDIDTLEERYKEAAREEASLKQEMKDPEGKGADSSAKEQNEETVSQEASGVNA